METKEQKKELLISILNVINSHRDLAEWLLIIIQEIDDEFIIDNILLWIQNWVKSIKSKREKEKIKKEIKQIYKKNDNKTKQDKENAEKFLEDFINNT